MTNKKSTLTTSMLLGLILSLCYLLAACGSREPEDRIFNLEVQDSVLVKGDPPLQVNQGDGVTIVVDTNEHILFHLHGYDIEQEASPGKPARLVFLANATGSYPFTIHATGSQGAHEHAASTHDCQATLPTGAPIPEIVLNTGVGHDPGEINVSVELENFLLKSETLGNEDLATGHWHLSIDGDLVGMYATPETTITVEKAGKHQFMATLSDNNHCEYGISSSVTVHVEEGGHGEEKEHHTDDGKGGHGEEKEHHSDDGKDGHGEEKTHHSDDVKEIELGRLDVLP